MKKIKICAIVLALLGNLLTLAAETILFKENFADCSSKNKYLKMAPVSDHSEIKQALELLSGKGPSGKFETATWVSPVFDAANAEMLTVDYFLKSTPQSHYALFVMGENGKMIVSVLVEKGKFSCNSAGPWVNVGEVKYGQWQKIRYVIYPVKKTFDVYIDDMSVPAARGLRYRFPEDTLPGKFWIKGSVTEDSQTSIANIVLRQNKSFSGLSQDLAAAPYFLLPVWEVDKPPATADWEKVQPVELGKIRAGAEEKSCFRALWDKENIYLQFEAEAKDMEPRKKGVTGKDQRIWINDCVEIFLSPGGGYPYYQLVANSIGSQYDARVDLGSIVDR